MKMIQGELERVRGEIARLRVEEALLEKMLGKMSGASDPKARVRSPSVKPVVLNVMRDAGATGATSAEVDDRVRQRVPTVAKHTVGSVLSRLKGDGALVYVGDRYYEKQFAPVPTDDPFKPGLRAVN